MSERRAFEAVIADMDGVLTRTAELHYRAWKRMFDAFLAARGDPRPFERDDYSEQVDGKPRYDGAADFLTSRGVELAWGEPSDPPGEQTIYGLGKRKNELFLELLAEQGAELFDDARVALERWRRGELKLAVVSASRNCRRVLASVGLDERVDAIVDGQTRAELELDGKRGLLREAARRLGVEPSRTVVLEDARSGLRAAREAGFGLVVGVDRQPAEQGNAQALERAGADRVVRDLIALRFARRLPSALARREAIAAWLGDRPLALFLDYDGTLTPIVADPAAADLAEATRSVIADLAGRWPVAVVSGRDRADVERRVGVEGIVYAGSHGFDIAGRGHRHTLADAERALPELDRAEQALRRDLAAIPGAIVERKRFGVAAHYRQVADAAEVEAVERAVDAVRQATGLRRRSGKKVLELQPEVEWDKGRALDWIVAVLDIDRSSQPLLYIGDDETDEDAFAALRGDGLGVRVGEELASTRADYCLADPDELRELLAWLVERGAGSPNPADPS